MQVSLNTLNSSSVNAHSVTARSERPIAAPQSVHNPKIAALPAKRDPFPEAALLSARPLRYNVQLNQQLTAVQQADNYLAQTEKQLLQLRHAAGRSDLRMATSKLQSLLDQRTALSGGTVDRHFNATFQPMTQVNFSLPSSEQLLYQPQGETLVFALGGNKRELAAVTLPVEGTPRQVLTQLNTALGRMGIHARQDSAGQVVFSVDESRWQRVSQQLSVRGEGGNFPANGFTLLAAQPEQAQQEALQQVVAEAGNRRENSRHMDTALERIITQRGKLRLHQERVSARINDMATPYTSQQAQDTARALAGVLEKSATHFADLSRVLSTQANIGIATVRNLLG